ncbi:Hypothetical predicted protein [Pelobates cultripes]|uniref:Uncharacterized protein n=1 Tax=Pelobates cultripes TaxID=61616 RepID=A0AAD1WWW6_PELCU|nr:Hypothetical predicted protein [Pelobates cultripes]
MLLLDCIHRVAKARVAPISAPMDVLLQANYHYMKEEIVRASRSPNSLAEVYKEVQIFADISLATLQARMNFNPVTKALRKHQIPYRLRFPTRLLITRNSQTTSVLTLEEGQELLKTWDIQLAVTPTTSVELNPHLPDWKKLKR